MKKLLGLLMACIFCISLSGEAFAATDLNGHYARAQMEHWISMGYISGYPDGTVRPDNNISRAEFYSIVNRAFGYYQLAPINFVDVGPNDWFYQDISKAVAAGYIAVDAEAKPNQKITREEVAVIVSFVAHLTPYDPGADLFSDISGSWRRPYIGAVAAAGIMRGYGDGAFRPFATITRAESIVTLSATLNRTKGIDLAYVPPIESGLVPITTNSNMQQHNPLQGTTTGQTTTTSQVPVESDFKTYALTITTSTYGNARDEDDVAGNVLVNTNSSSIRNIDISGDLVFSSNVKGSITLTNVYVSGNIYVFGNPNITMENSEAKELIINSPKNDTKVTLKRSSDISVVRLYSGASLYESGISGIYSGFQDVILELGMPTSSKVTLSGSFADVDVYSERISLALTNGSIDNLMIDQAAERGTYSISSGTVVEYVDVNARNSNFTGNGRIKTADVRERSVSFNKRPDTVFGEYGDYYDRNNSDYGYGEYMLDIFVTDSNGYPVEDADITIYRDYSSSVYASGYTASDGIFYAWLNSGDYYITVRKSGYAEKTYSLRMYNRDEEVTIKLGSGTTKTNINVYIHESTGTSSAPLKDTVVSLVTAASSESTSGIVVDAFYSSQNGEVHFYDVAEGYYVVIIEKEGYISQLIKMTVTSSDGSLSHYITMQKDPAASTGTSTP